MKRTLPAAAALASFALYAADPPPVKEGLWSIHTVSTNNPGNQKSEGTRSICRTHAYDTRIRQQAEIQQKQSCKIVNRSSSGNTFTEETECTVQGSTIKGKTVTTFSGDSSVHSETHSANTPALYGVADSTIIIDQKYVGPCPAGMEPGDYMSSDGKITHVQRAK